MKRSVFVVVLVVLSVLALGSSAPSREPSFAFVARPSATGIQLECVKGCAWTRLEATCLEAPCQFAVDELECGVSRNRPPNKSLQRTRLRAPLSSKPLGARS